MSSGKVTKNGKVGARIIIEPGNNGTVEAGGRVPECPGVYGGPNLLKELELPECKPGVSSQIEEVGANRKKKIEKGKKQTKK